MNLLHQKSKFVYHLPQHWQTVFCPHIVFNVLLVILAIHKKKFARLY